MEQDKFSHLDKDGSANMVDISEKNITNRFASASCTVELSEKAYSLVKENQNLRVQNMKLQNQGE